VLTFFYRQIVSTIYVCTTKLTEKKIEHIKKYIIYDSPYKRNVVFMWYVAGDKVHNDDYD